MNCFFARKIYVSIKNGEVEEIVFVQFVQDTPVAIKRDYKEVRLNSISLKCNPKINV